MPYVHTALQANVLHDNGYNVDNTDYFKCSVFARWVFTTDARRAVIKAWSTNYNTYAAGAQLEVRRGGALVTTLQCTGQGLNTFDIALTGTGPVEIISSIQSISAGTFPRMVYFYQGTTATLVTPTQPAPRLVVYGDSIAVGGDIPTYPIHEAWPMLIRNDWAGTVMMEAWGARTLDDDCTDAAARTAFANRIAGYEPTIVWLSIGTNDYAVDQTSAATFGTQYADFLDKLHSALPSAAIYAQSPLSRSSEGANSSGSTCPNFRTQISTACGSRAWATYVHGPDMLTLSDIPDGVHPSTAGHVLLAAAARDAMGI